ncbi:aminoglycoside adenylyltransferase domain-containing protein [Paenibacillus sepulcri]
MNRIAALFKEAMKDNLTGVYLHGSLAMGCFNPGRSDIDLLVVARKKLSVENRKQIVRKILALNDELPGAGGIELSVVLESELTDFVYPTPVELHYSEFHREKYQTDENYSCSDYVDYDLAAQYAVAYDRGTALYGQPLRALFQPVGRQYYAASILYDIENAYEHIVENPVYMTLNLCRVLYFLQEGVISSKKEGGDWGIKTLTGAYHPLIQQCLDVYAGLTDSIEAGRSELTEFAAYMSIEIQKAV